MLRCSIIPLPVSGSRFVEKRERAREQGGSGDDIAWGLVQGQILQKPRSRFTRAKPELKLKLTELSIIFSCIKMSFTAYALCSLRLFKLKTEGQTV